MTRRVSHTDGVCDRSCAYILPTNMQSLFDPWDMQFCSLRQIRNVQLITHRMRQNNRFACTPNAKSPGYPMTQI